MARGLALGSIIDFLLILLVERRASPPGWTGETPVSPP